MKKIILSLLAPLAVFAAVVFVSPTTSQAQAANCPAGFVCTPITTPNVTPASPTPDSCPVIIIDGYRYSLNPCRISMEMIDGAGNKPFSITVNQVGGSEKSYGITRYGYGENLPMYSILGDSGVGAYGNQKINFYFNDSVLNSINSQIQSYTGRLPLHIFHSSERNDQNYLYLGIDLKVKPSQITASSSALATLSLNAASPITSTVLVTDKVNNSYSALPVLVFDIGAQNDNLLLKNVDVQIIPSTQGSTGKVNTAYLYQGSTLIASAAVRNDIASFSNIPTGAIGGDIPAHTTKGYTIKADVSGVGTGNGYTIKASVMDGGISVIGRSGILVKVVGSAKGYPITVVSSYSNGTAPQFSLASTPSISKTLLSTDPYGNASSTFMAIFNIIVSNTGSSDIVIPLPGASNLPVARAFDFSIYKNGVVYNNLPGSGNPVINGQVSYSQPSGSRLSTDGMSFVVSRNQVVTIPVVYIFQLRNVGSDSYNVGLNSINWLDVNNKFQTISYAGNPAWRTIEGGGSSNGGSGVPTASTPQFSLLSRPVISKTVSVTDQNGNSVTNYRTTYNIYVSNMSSTDINIPLANGGGILSVAKAFDFEIYKNGVIYNSMPGSGNTAINGQISYSQPTGTTLSSDRGTFVVQRNQSVTIPVMYSFQVPNAGSNSYHVGMNSINWLIPGNYFKTQSFSGNSAWRTIDEGLTSTSPSGSSVGIPTSSSTSSASAACYQFNLNLRRGDANPDVYMLQTLLIANGFDIPSVTSRLNSKGTFDADTEMAVIKYQNSKGIPATGFFGPLTRAALSASCGSPSPRPNTTPDACPVGFICNTIPNVTPTVVPITTPTAVVCPAGFICSTAPTASPTATPVSYTTPTAVPASKSIVVQSPVGNSYQAGSQIYVSWYENYTAPQVTIDIFNSQTLVNYYQGKIGDRAVGVNTTYLPREASNVPAGQYYVTVCDTGTYSIDKSACGKGYFTIASPNTTPVTTPTGTSYPTPTSVANQPSLSISSPNGGTYRAGSTLNISWYAPGLTTANNSIGLAVYRTSLGSTRNLLSTTVGNPVLNGQVSAYGSYSWTIPSTAPEGSDYVVYISGIAGWKQSVPFTVTSSTSGSPTPTPYASYSPVTTPNTTPSTTPTPRPTTTTTPTPTSTVSPRASLDNASLNAAIWEAIRQYQARNQ